MITAGAIPLRHERIAARVIDGKAVIVVIDDHRLHTLNEVGTRVFELCDGRSLDAIASALSEEFEVEHGRALDDARGFVQTLVDLGAVTVERAA